MPDRTLWTLPEGAVVQAGAGTGKTHSLITLCLHLLGGVGRDEPLPPARLWAVTFTEKAAAELKGRLRKRVDRLAAGDASHEKELAETGALPDVAVWRRARRDLGLAQVGTIHALCAQILRRHAPAAGLDPRFAVLDERDAARALQDACELAALRALDGAYGEQLRDAVRALCAEMGFRSQGKYGSGLADEVRRLIAVLGESGRDPLRLAETTPGLDPAVATAQDAAARTALLESFEGLRGTQTPKAAQVAAAMLHERENVAAALSKTPAGRLVEAWPALRRIAVGGNNGPAVKAVREALTALCEADAAVRSCSFARLFAAVAAEALKLYRAEKARLAALDFDDLTRLARDLLRDSEAVRDSERARVGVLLVDEFQDTSRTQLELFSWLVGSGAPGPARRGALVVVGDRKQSIYDFRGADVAGAQAFAKAAEKAGARRHVLGESRRSRPALVRFANLLFSSALASGGRPFETPFTADDALTAVRPEGPAGACAELLDVSGKGVEAEAEAVARRISAMLSGEACVLDGETPRAVRGGDIAILLRRFTNLETFRRALLRRRIPHLVYKGRGFHAAREIVDLVALLTLAVDPSDALALATVLRSPFGPVSDDGLTLLSRERGLRMQALRDTGALAPDDRDAVERIRALVDRMHREADRLGPSALLEGALASTDYVAARAAGLHGEQAAANLDKLLGLARAAEVRGIGVRPFLASLRQLADEEAREPDAPVVEERDPHAVRLMTVHAAKGLEFPVVFVPECGSPLQTSNADRVAVDADLGLAFKVRAADGERRWGAHGTQVSETRKERELAQSRRLLYVAATRARDYLVFSSATSRYQNSWRRCITDVADEAAAQGLLTRLVDGPPLPLAARVPAPVDDAALAQLAQTPPGAPPEPRSAAPVRAISAPVTQIADAALCARRYQLLHELRLEERPDPDPELPDPLGEEPGQRATAVGTLAHRLLEVAPLELPPAERRAALERELRLEGEDPAQHGAVLDAACAFLESPLGARMAKAGARLHRELPFTLRLQPRDAGPELLLRGQLDALLLEDDAATVVDYKLSKARDPERYGPQLDAYALAAHELVLGNLPVRTGIVFLRSKNAPWAERPPVDSQKLAVVRERLLAAARTIAEGRQTGQWARIGRDRCEAIGCGFVERCHGAPGD